MDTDIYVLCALSMVSETVDKVSSVIIRKGVKRSIVTEKTTVIKTAVETALTVSYVDNTIVKRMARHIAKVVMTKSVELSIRNTLFRVCKGVLDLAESVIEYQDVFDDESVISDDELKMWEELDAVDELRGIA